MKRTARPPTPAPSSLHDARSAGTFARAPHVVDEPEPDTEKVTTGERAPRRPAAATIPLVPPLAIESEVGPNPRELPTQPGSARTLQTPHAGPNLRMPGTNASVPPVPTSSGSLASSVRPIPSGRSPALSVPCQAEEFRPSSPSQSAEDGIPLGYVVASAFFLAIAIIGFGLWLALEVIAL